MSWQRIGSVSRLIFLDGLRRYTLFGLLVFSITAELSGLFFFDFFARDVGRASSDFLFSIMWLAGLIYLFFHAVQVIAWGEERGIIYTILSRPISRVEYIAGVYVGLASLLLGLQLLLGILAFGALEWIRQTLDPIYFPVLSLSHYLLAWAGLVVMQLMLLAAIILFSGLVRGGFPVLILSLAYYFICSGLPVVRESLAQQSAQGGDPPALSYLLQGLSAVFPDFQRLDFKDWIVSLAPMPQLFQITTSFSLAAAYILVLMAFAGMLYERRDLH
ncbi:MAG: hypothetical protein ACE5DY_01420 [Mariprofundaceae bacterium]